MFIPAFQPDSTSSIVWVSKLESKIWGSKGLWHRGKDGQAGQAGQKTCLRPALPAGSPDPGATRPPPLPDLTRGHQQALSSQTRHMAACSGLAHDTPAVSPQKLVITLRKLWKASRRAGRRVCGARALAVTHPHPSSAAKHRVLGSPHSRFLQVICSRSPCR